ncbi:MAG: hypothetical protein R2873_11970 [Caldilineaceae bacterium]
MILIASTLAQNGFPQNAGLIVVLVLIIVVFGLGALLWSAIADSSKEPSSPVRVLRAPVAPSRPKDEPVVAEPPVVAAPHAAVPVATTLPAPAAPAAAPEPVVEEQPIVEEVYVPEEPAAEPIEPGEPDDLKRIEGIGPKISSVLAEDGIITFAQLAAMTPDQIREVLTGRVRLFNPDTWPEQAALAAEDRWDDLVAFQETLKGGRRA